MAFGVVGLGVGTYFLVRYLNLKKSYQTTLDINQANQLINQKTANIPDTIIPDEVTKNADLPKGTDYVPDTSDDNTNDFTLPSLQQQLADFESQSIFGLGN